MLGCVGLSKPKAVEECATAGNCSNDPIEPPGPDAAEDTRASDSDLRNADALADHQDLGPDRPNLDAPVDQAAPEPDTKDASRTDGNDTSPGTEAGLPLPDAGLDLRHDLAPDLGPDLGPDLRPDLGRDVGPDLGPDLGPDVGPDVSPDTSTLLSGLVVYYKCESATGTTLPDSSGNNNNGTLASGSASGYSFAAGKVGKSLALSQANRVTFPYRRPYSPRPRTSPSQPGSTSPPRRTGSASSTWASMPT